MPTDPAPDDRATAVWASSVAREVIRHQLAGRTGHVREALEELTVPQLRQLAQAFTAATSACAQVIVAKNITAKRAARGPV
jgi:hypothetical protein